MCVDSRQQSDVRCVKRTFSSCLLTIELSTYVRADELSLLQKKEARGLNGNITLTNYKSAKPMLEVTTKTTENCMIQAGKLKVSLQN